MDGGTTHISVVDEDRNAVCLTQTNMSWSGVIVPGVGVMMNNAMTWFYPAPGTVNSIVPGGRGLNNMTPLILVRDGRLHAVLGASGGRRIWSALVQACVNHAEFGMDLQQAVQVPRLHVESDQVLLGRPLRRRSAGRPGAARTRGHGGDPVLQPLTLRGAERHTGSRRRAPQRPSTPVAKPTHAAGYPGDTLEDSDAGIDAGMLSHP